MSDLHAALLSVFSLLVYEHQETGGTSMRPGLQLLETVTALETLSHRISEIVTSLRDTE